jgi:nitrite reductase (NADH) small subunit
MVAHRIGRAEEIAMGAFTPVKVGRTSILITRLPSGDLTAIAAKCPHQGADLAFGCITGMAAGADPHSLHQQRPGEILRCPWHGFEFDLVNGQALVEPSSLRLRHYPVRVEAGDVFIET